MDILDFFDRDKSLARIRLPSAQVAGDLTTTLELEETYVYEEPAPNAPQNFDYAEKYRKEEEALSLQNAALLNQESYLLRPDSPTTIDSAIRDNEMMSEISGSIYSKYKFDHHIQNPNLSINSYQEQITDMICTNSVIVIQGPTGCGKTTQVPQYILDYCQQRNQYCKIAVTQPRRIAAISVAKRVSEERGWPLGSIVGYQVGLDNKTTEDSILTYMTTGVLLQKLIKSKSFCQYTHIIIDEVHEREADMDFLLLVIRRFLRTIARSVKVIVMSATIDVDHFANYFQIPRGLQLASAPVIDVTKTQPYTVNMYYLNQFHDRLGTVIPHFHKDEPEVFHVLYDLVLKLLRIFDTFDADCTSYGSVLIFLPGIYEIQDLYELLERRNSDPINWFVVPLHSSITNEEQKKAFFDTPPGHRKIILSTNIAESSITVPDVVYVIDFCLTKILRCDPLTNYSSLELSWASQTNCQQRSGRVGRVSSGRVYRLVPDDFYQKLDRDVEPEMLRSPLHRLVLMAKTLELDLPPEGILALAIDHPPLEKIGQTITLLKEAGALQITRNGAYFDNDGDLTHIGRIMVQLPLDINVSKLIILGYIFSTLKECVIMAAAMTLQNIFSSPFHERMKAYQSKLSWADCSCSDLIAYLHVYVVWERNKYNNLFRQSGGEKAWMKRNFLQPRVMREWKILVQDLKQRLVHIGITEPIQGRQGNLTEHEKAMMLKVVISGAFYPNYFVRSSEGGQVDESLAVRQLGGRDPFNTVYFTGKPENQPVELYVQSIRELLKECGQNLHVSHDNSNKIYVQFKNNSLPTNIDTGRNNPIVPGKIAIEVYNAVKFRHNKLPNTIKCVSAEEAQRRVRQWKKYQEEKEREIETETVIQSAVPGFEVSYIEIRIAHVNNPGHFYAQNVDEVVKNMLFKIEKDLNTLTLSDPPSEVVVGKLYAAPYNGKLYRGRVISEIVVPTKETKVQIIFIDYGNVECVSQSKLRHLLPGMYNIPPMALECVLTNIQPSHSMDVHALWTKQATDEFNRLVRGRTVFGKVYSVVDNVVSLELYTRQASNRTDNLETVNQVLIQKGFAQFATESFLSQDNHKKREYAQNSTTSSTPYSSYIEWYDKSNEMPAPKPEECRMTMKLQGPYCPLEMKIFGILQCNLNKNIAIEWNSVNSVLLDTNPQDPHDRLIVSGTVNQSPDGSKLTLRHTTIMPNIHGFPVLMALIFSPKMELHTNKDGTRLTSILCGLGYNPVTKRSLYPAHDLTLNLDFELSDDVITKVNEVRYFMNTAIEAMRCFSAEGTPSVPIETSQNEIRKLIRYLLKLQHTPIEREVLINTYQWGKLPPNVEVVGTLYSDKTAVWMMHSSLKLHDAEKAEVRKHLTELRDIGNKVLPMSEIVCKLCHITLYDSTQVRIHLMSEKHKQNGRIFNGET